MAIGNCEENKSDIEIINLCEDHRDGNGNGNGSGNGNQRPMRRNVPKEKCDKCNYFGKL